VARRVCDQETSNEEAKARYGVVENTTKRVATPRKQKTNNVIKAFLKSQTFLPSEVI
jgi:hypothetical protein